MSDPAGPRATAPLEGARTLPEGAELPPSGVRTMAIVRWALVALMAVVAGGTWVRFAGVATGAAARSAQYHCPMHPSVVKDRPGECAICGMDLVPVEASRASAGNASASPTRTAGATEGAGKYWCPMHPDVSSDDAEARCQKCGGMKLVPRSAPVAADQAPPGLAPVEIDAARTQLIGMRTARVTREHVTPQLRTVGFVSVDEKRLALVTARFTGWIEKLEVAQGGERVEKGQILASVYIQDLVTAQQVFLNSLRWADKKGQASAAPGTRGLEYDARKRLELLGMAPQDLAEIARRGEPTLSLPVRAPAAGYVARKAALPGMYVQPGTELFEIADLSTVWVVADVHERDLDRVEIGQRARLTLPARPAEAFSGRVQFISPAVNPESHTVQARMEFRNPGLRLKPGMHGDVVLEAPGRAALAVPVEAVIDTGELQYVFLSRPGNRFEPRRVKLGARGDGRVEVLDGLVEGDTVVTTANFLVDSESRLRSAVEGFRPVSPDEGRRERERGADDDREHARN
jgi:membrane fusion protein, copper/silver efflux system